MESIDRMSEDIKPAAGTEAKDIATLDGVSAALSSVAETVIKIASMIGEIKNNEAHEETETETEEEKAE